MSEPTHPPETGKAGRRGLFLLPWRYLDAGEAADYLHDRLVNHVSLSVKDSQGLALYPSEVVPRSWSGGADLLERVALAFTKKGIHTHASIACFADMAAAQEAPERLALRHDGTPAMPGVAWEHWADGFYYHLCPLQPETQDRLVAVVRELARYPIDGIDLDFIRFPYQPAGEYDEGWFCYCDHCTQAYEAAFGTALPQPGGPAEDWANFLDWRSSQLTAFIERLNDELKAIDAAKRLHMYVAVYGSKRTGPEQLEATAARYGQHAAKLKTAVDAIQPMLYHRFSDEPLCYTRQNLFWIKTMTHWFRRDGPEVWPAVQGELPVTASDLGGALENAVNGGARSVLVYPGREWYMTQDRWDAIARVFRQLHDVKETV